MKHANEPGFSAVDFQRKRRLELNKMRNDNPEKFYELLSEIRKKYGNKSGKKTKKTG